MARAIVALGVVVGNCPRPNVVGALGDGADALGAAGLDATVEGHLMLSFVQEFEDLSVRQYGSHTRNRISHQISQPPKVSS